MAHRSALGLLALASLVFVACDKQGVHPLGVRKDVIVQCDVQSTWLRSVEGATEVLIVGTDDFSSLEDALGDEGAVCFNFARVERDSTTKLLAGTLRLAESEEDFEVEFSAEYNFVYDPNTAPTGKKGAERTDYDPTLIVPDVDFEALGDGSLLLDFQGERRRFVHIGDVIARLDPTETDIDVAGGPTDIFRMVNLALLISQPRIPSFGGIGMTTYVGEKTPFSALISGGFTVEVEAILRPNAFIDYLDFEELEGIFIHGLQITRPDFGGNGNMEGTLDYRLHTRGSSTPFISGILNYDDMQIGRGVASGGFYNFGVEGDEYQLSWELAANEDLTGILPIEEGVP